MRPILGTMVIGTLFAMAGPAHADDAAVQKTLLANYAKISDALRKSDFAAVSEFMTTDYVATQPKGQKLNRDQALAAMTQQREVMFSADWQRKISKLTVNQNEAVATVQSRMFGIMSDPQGQHHKLLMITSSKDTWVKGGGRWKLKSYRFLTGSMSLDGKPLAPAALGK